MIQGGLSGVLAVVAFAVAVTILGASRAAVFPALVPSAGILVGIPLTGEWPSPLQWVGVALVTVGLIAALGVRVRFRRRAAA
ncbi:EamA-like transporter family protein [compost metagenome]